MNARRLKQILAQARTKRILVIGDLMLDEFVWGKVGRISPEAPVPVVEVTGESFYPGGAANVARNLREFTGSVAAARAEPVPIIQSRRDVRLVAIVFPSPVNSHPSISPARRWA